MVYCVFRHNCVFAGLPSLKYLLCRARQEKRKYRFKKQRYLGCSVKSLYRLYLLYPPDMNDFPRNCKFSVAKPSKKLSLRRFTVVMHKIKQDNNFVLSFPPKSQKIEKNTLL